MGLVRKLEAYALQDEGLDTFEANEALGLARDGRDYAVAAQMLTTLGAADVTLLSNNPEKAAQLTGYGITVRETVPTGVFVTDTNRRYLEAKARVGGHRIVLDAPGAGPRPAALWPPRGSSGIPDGTGPVEGDVQRLVRRHQP